MKLTVGAKIAAGYAVALAILLCIGIVALQSTRTLTKTAEDVTHTHEVLNELQSLLQVLIDAETGQRGFLITGDDSYLDPYNGVKEKTEKTLAQIRKLTTENEDQDRNNADQKRNLVVLEPLVDHKVKTLAEGIQIRKSDGAQASTDWIKKDKGKEQMDLIRKAIAEMVNVEDVLLVKRSKIANDSADNSNNTILAGTAIAFVVLTLLAIFITRNIAVPLRQITNTAEKIASGELGSRITLTARTDEVGELSQSFDKMTRALAGMADVAGKIASGDLRVQVSPQSERDILGNAFKSMIENLQILTRQITEGVSVLASSTNQISTSTAQLAAGASETAVAVSQTTTTVEEVRQTAQVATQKSKLVSDNAHHVAQATISGQKATQATLEAMKRIRQQMDSIADSMARLSEQTQAIGQIIASVEDLATQSNLLAVNAAIEAAKAGEQGKGFGVVAQEVRSLAEQSKQATNQVRTILNDIQKAASAAVMATEQGSKAVEHGVKQSGDTGDAIQTLSSSVSEAAQAATQIAASSQQQLVGVDQVAAAMVNIRQASTQNADSAKQLESAAHSLKELGTRLDLAIRKYKA